MDIQSEKLEIIQWLTGLTDQEIIHKIVLLKEAQKTNLSIGEIKAIDKGLQTLKEGRVKTQQEVISITRQKYPQFFQ